MSPLLYFPISLLSGPCYEALTAACRQTISLVAKYLGQHGTRHRIITAIVVVSPSAGFQCSQRTEYSITINIAL